MPSESEYPVEIKQALEDLKRIREVLAVSQKSEPSHPLRIVIRPFMLFSIYFGAVMFAFGVASQLILDQNYRLGQLSPATLIWMMAAIVMIAGTVAKNMIIASASRKAGYDLSVIYKEMFTIDYARSILPTFIVTAVAATALGLAGGSDMIFGVITVGIGAVWISYGTIFPFREMTFVGIFLVISGIPSTFFFPEWTFYKLALIWGLGLLVCGAVIYRMVPSTVKQDSKAEGQE